MSEATCRARPGVQQPEWAIGGLRANGLFEVPENAYANDVYIFLERATKLHGQLLREVAMYSQEL